VLQRVGYIASPILLILLGATAVSAQGVAFGVADGLYPQALLQRVNLETGELTLVGAVGYPVTHIAFDSAENLYGIDAENDQLLVIDVSGGGGFPVGPLGTTIVEVTGLAFDADDRLWMTAWDELDGPSFFEVDAASGLATRIAGLDLEYLGSLASRRGVVYLAGRTLSVVDTATGEVQPVQGSSFGMWFARASDFDDDGRLRSLLLCEPCMVPFDVLIASEINPGTGVLSGTAVPEPHGTWALAILRSGVFFDGFEGGTTSGWTVGLR
jgi:hypothetical protein